jgi:type VI secretion system protein ImpH
MAGEDRDEAQRLIGALSAEPYRFDFFHAVRRLECACADLPRIGRSRRPGEDPIRFGQNPSLAFAPSTLHAVETDGPVPRMLVNFLGLLGPDGPLPLHLTEYVHDRRHNHDDETLARFLDVFHHRMLSLFYRSWAMSRPTVSADRPEEDRFGDYVGSLFGLGADPFHGRGAVPDRAKLHFAGRLALATKNAEGLEAILASYFRVPCRIEQFVGRWIEIPPDSRLHLGVSPESGSLGTTAVVGTRTWDCQQQFRLVLGPMDLDEYEHFLPGSPGWDRLTDWIRTYVGFELAWDVTLVLRAESVPMTQLGGDHGARLGLTSWIRSGPQPRDADDLTLTEPPITAA